MEPTSPHQSAPLPDPDEPRQVARAYSRWAMALLALAGLAVVAFFVMRRQFANTGQPHRTQDGTISAPATSGDIMRR